MTATNQEIYTQTIYYVYVLVDPRNEQPFYVGKGKGDRVQSHYYNWKSVEKCNPFKSRIINKLKRLGYQPKYEIVFKGPDEKLAFEIEKKFIAKWGRRNIDNNGILVNINPGGLGCNFKVQRPVKQYNLSGEYIQTFDSCLEAARSVGKERSSLIVDCCRKRKLNKTAWGYFWCYAEEELDLKWCFERKRKPIYQWDLLGNYITKHVSSHQAARHLQKPNCNGEILKSAKNGTMCQKFQWTFDNKSPGKYKNLDKFLKRNSSLNKTI